MSPKFETNDHYSNRPAARCSIILVPEETPTDLQENVRRYFDLSLSRAASRIKKNPPQYLCGSDAIDLGHSRVILSEDHDADDDNTNEGKSYYEYDPIPEESIRRWCFFFYFCICYRFSAASHRPSMPHDTLVAGDVQHSTTPQTGQNAKSFLRPTSSSFTTIMAGVRPSIVDLYSGAREYSL